jgi:cytochrome o ubiquinol oxidase operon protein cyoD
MSQNSHTTTATHGAGRGSLRSYATGFVLSLVLTFAAYFLVVDHVLTGNLLIAAIMGLAVAQLLVQLLFFLHLGRGSDSRWNLTVFAFMLLVLVIVVFGSLWIMNNLNYNMMSPQNMDEYMKHQSEKGF